jgi:uncharacterized Ntn-hydrolase superfamily protein
MSLLRLRLAVEAYDAPQDTIPNDGVNQTIVMKGPLSDIYTKALNIAYAKKDKLTGEVEPVEETNIVQDTKVGGAMPPANNILQDPVAIENLVSALESQAIDAALMEKLSRTLNDASDDAPPTDSFQTVYGVSRDDLNEEDLVSIAKDVSTQPESTSEYIVVIDRTGCSSDDPEQVMKLSSAIESLIDAFGGKVFSSLEDYVHYQATLLG